MTIPNCCDGIRFLRDNDLINFIEKPNGRWHLGLENGVTVRVSFCPNCGQKWPIGNESQNITDLDNEVLQLVADFTSIDEFISHFGDGQAENLPGSTTTRYIFPEAFPNGLLEVYVKVDGAIHIEIGQD